MHHLAVAHPLQPLKKSTKFKLVRQHFILRLAQQQVVWIVVLEHLQQQVGGRQQMALLDRGAGKTLKHEPRNGRDIPEFAANQFRRVEACGQVVHQVRWTQQIRVLHTRPRNGLVGQEFEAVVVAGPVEGLGGQQTQAIRQEHGQGFVDFSAFEGIQEQMMSIPIFQRLHEQLVSPGNATALRLDLDHGCQPLQLGLPSRIRVGQTVPSETQPVRQLRTEGHSAAHPSRCARRRGLGPAHLRHKALEGHQRDRMACEDKRVSLAQGGHKRLLHVAKQSLSLEMDRHHGRADNGPHAHAVTPGFGPVTHAPEAFLINVHASVLCVRAQRGAARRDQIEALPPVVLLHFAVGMGVGQHRPDLLGLKTISHRKRA